MADMFSSMMTGGDTDNAVSVLKQLLDKENIEMKTDLNINQIRVLTQLKLLHLLKEKDPVTQKDRYTAKEALEKTIEHYLMLMVSLRRQSWTQITDAVKSMRPEYADQNVLGAAFGGKK